MSRNKYAEELRIAREGARDAVNCAAGGAVNRAAGGAAVSAVWWVGGCGSSGGAGDSAGDARDAAGEGELEVQIQLTLKELP